MRASVVAWQRRLFVRIRMHPKSSHYAYGCRWRKIEFPPHAHIPEPRAGCVFVLVGDVVLLHGGFAKVRDTHRRVQGKTFTVGEERFSS